MSNSLFKEFDSVSSKAWKQKIQADLKGADYNDTLIWNTKEGIDVKPFYHADDFKDLPQISNTKSKTWKIGQHITVTNAKDANSRAIDAIKRGAECIIFLIDNQQLEADLLLKNINVPVVLQTKFLSQHFVSLCLKNQTIKQPLTFNTDIIGHLSKSGNWYNNITQDFKDFEAIVKQTNQLYINLKIFQNAGANTVQQLAYALAHVNEYLNYLETKLSDQEKASLIVVFDCAVGGNYFFEISKLKALRRLWASLATEYAVNTECQIFTTPSIRNKTIYDYNVNLLRTTTECMSAVLGGADMVYNLPYNALFQNPTEFGERISRNQLLILKNESYFNAVDNPTDGAYYIENLTEQLSKKALDIFKDIETNQGFLSQLKNGTIQRKIKESATTQQNDFNNGKSVLLGTNIHPNTADKMKDSLERQPFMVYKKRKTLIEPIVPKRLSEQLELDRLNKEQ